MPVLAAAAPSSLAHKHLTFAHLTVALMVPQVQHSRRGGVVSKLETGRFGGGRALKLSAAGQLPGGSALEADLGAERLDNQILLDYGVLDEERPQVLPCAQLMSHEEAAVTANNADQQASLQLVGFEAHMN